MQSSTLRIKSSFIYVKFHVQNKECRRSWGEKVPYLKSACHAIFRQRQFYRTLGRLDSLKWKLCLLAWALASIQTCSQNGLMTHLFLVYFFSFEDSVCLSSPYHLICPLETFQYWSNHESFCTSTCPVIFILSPSFLNFRRKTENIFIKIFHRYAERSPCILNMCGFFSQGTDSAHLH